MLPFFDISKAFDKVWWPGLLFKLINLNLPPYILVWIKNFLENRRFKVKVNDSFSNFGNISAGVPQGAIISPLLFNLYINDIPKRDKPNVSYSELYADDLISFFIFNIKGNIEKIINNYLKEIERWLVKWKLKMSTKKCSYLIFNNGNQQINFSLKLFGDNIPINSNPKMLGIIFDRKLGFRQHIESIRSKCSDRLKLIKILSYKKWNLETSTLISIYKSLIGSIIDYTNIIYNQLSNTLEDFIAVTQNQALRTIFHKPRETPISILNQIGLNHKLKTIKTRAKELNVRYFKNAINYNNQIVIKLLNEYKIGFTSRKIERKTPICAIWDSIKEYII